MIRGIFYSKSGVVLLIIAFFIVIPLFLFKMGITGNIYVDTFTNQYWAFGTILVAGCIMAYPLFRPHWISVVIVVFLMVIAYAYVFTLLGVA